MAYGYDAWGGPLAPAPLDQAGLGYRGELTLGHLTHLRARDYNPASGAFTTPDPLDGVDGTPVIANPYHYANNSPLAMIDPLGLRATDASIEPPRSSAFEAALDIPLACHMGLQTMPCRFMMAEYWARYDSYGIGRQALTIGAEVLGAADLRRCAGSADPASCVMAAISVLPGDDAARGLRSLRALRSRDQAVDGFRSMTSFRRAYGSAPEGMQWHHIVEQTPGNRVRFGPEALHNTWNVIPLDAHIHRQVSGYYSSIQPSFTGGQTVRQWLSTQPYDVQRQFGQRVMRQFGAAP